jgi:hypothetical protein
MKSLVVASGLIAASLMLVSFELSSQAQAAQDPAWATKRLNKQSKNTKPAPKPKSNKQKSN